MIILFVVMIIIFFRCFFRYRKFDEMEEWNWIDIWYTLFFADNYERLFTLNFQEIFILRKFFIFV